MKFDRMVSPTCKNRLRDLRNQSGLTLEELAHTTGISASTIRALEADKGDVKLGTALRLAHFYGLPLETIWGAMYDEIRQQVTRPSTPTEDRNSDL